MDFLPAGLRVKQKLEYERVYGCSDYTKNHAADRALHRLFGADVRAKLMLAEKRTHKICAGVGHPWDDERHRNVKTRVRPVLVAQDDNTAHSQQDERRRGKGERNVRKRDFIVPENQHGEHR